MVNATLDNLSVDELLNNHRIVTRKKASRKKALTTGKIIMQVRKGKEYYYFHYTGSSKIVYLGTATGIYERLKGVR